MTLRAEFKRFTLLPMQPATTPSCVDLIAHTIGHFARVSEEWDRIPPSKALSPASARAALDGRGVDVEEFSRHRDRRETHRLPASCWLDPCRGEVIRFHGGGYWPRYAELIQRAGPPHSSQWWDTPDEQGHYDGRRATHLGDRKLAALPSGDGTWRAITAFRRGVFIDTGSAGGSANTQLGLALERLTCQNPALLASLRRGPDEDAEPTAGGVAR